MEKNIDGWQVHVGVRPFISLFYLEGDIFSSMASLPFIHLSLFKDDSTFSDQRKSTMRPSKTYLHIYTS